MRAGSRLVLAALVGAAAPGCYFGHIDRDIDRAPTVDTGAGASIIMPGQSVPMVVPGAGASGGSGAPAAAQRSRAETGEPAPAQGAPISMIGGSQIDEERHLEIREEPVWWKYVTLPFAVVAAPFKLAADSVRGKPEAGPALPEQAPERPEAARSQPRPDYESARLQQLDQELDRRVGSAPAPAPARPPAPVSISDELAALQRVPTTGARAEAPRSAEPRPIGAAVPPSRQAAAAAPGPADGIVDRDGDGRVDLWIYREGGRIARRVLDEDFDGRPDRTLVYDSASEELARVEEDANEDGAIDAWTEYEAGAIRRRRADADFDGAVDTWTFYRDGRIVRHEQDATGDGFRDRVGFYEEGRLVRDEVDGNADGRPDVVNHYDAEERVVRREEDTDFDGSVDRVSHFESGRLARREIIDPEAR
jgi:hypothetical protein